jgi:hypothetical protein
MRGGCCEHGNEPSGSIKCPTYVDCLHAGTGVVMPTFSPCDVQTLLQACHLADCLLSLAFTTDSSTSEAVLKMGTGNRPGLFPLIFIPNLFIEELFMVYLKTLLVA